MEVFSRNGVHVTFVTAWLRDYTASSVKHRCEKDSKGMAMSSERPVNLDLTTFRFPDNCDRIHSSGCAALFYFLEVLS